MNRLFTVLFLLTIYSCSDDDLLRLSSEDCVWSDSVDNIFDKFDDPQCSYTDVLEYEGEFYTVCYCCVCGKFAPIVSCDGTNLCTSSDMCRENFFEQAEYKYSFN